MAFRFPMESPPPRDVWLLASHVRGEVVHVHWSSLPVWDCDVLRCRVLVSCIDEGVRSCVFIQLECVQRCYDKLFKVIFMC
jgi:hypothetical protein